MSRQQRSERACGRAIQQMIEAAHNYCLEFKGATDQSLGDDCVLGPEMRAILSGIHGLLNGPSGGIDCGTEWARVQSIAERAGLLEDNGEI